MATRDELVLAAAGLLARHGPSGLSARRLAAAVGTSTMAVYTHFSGMPALGHAVVAEGFSRLDAQLRLLRPTDDAVADLRAVARAYRQNALDNPHLYAVMFGGESAIGDALTEADRSVATPSLGAVAEAAQRAVDAGLLPPLDKWEFARRFWAAAHGAVSLELNGYLGGPGRAAATYEAVVEAAIRGAASADVG